MPQINLVWNDSQNRFKNYQLSLLEADLHKKTNIGRDQQRCEIWIEHNTVSRVHAEISFKSDWQRFYLRNIAANNPPRVDGGILTEGEVALYDGSIIQFGQVLIQVSDVVVEVAAAYPNLSSPLQSPVTPTPAASPPSKNLAETAPSGHHQAVHQHIHTPPAQNSAPAQNVVVNAQSQSAGVQTPSVAPKLVCPKCQTMQLLSLRNSNCPVCGHFLADASSRYFF